MTNEQLWLAIGTPLLFNGLIFIFILTNMNARFANMETSLGSLDQRMDLLMGAMHELDNRLTRIEHR